jgi:hypothetical protein
MPGVRLERGSTLALNGFAIREAADPAVDCLAGGCTIAGGEIVDAVGRGVAVGITARLIRRGLVLSDLRIVGCGGAGVDAPMAGVDATRVEASGNGASGIRAWDLWASDVITSDNGHHGVLARGRVIARTFTADGNQINGIQTLHGRVRLADAHVTANVHAGIAARRLHLDGGEVSGNNAGAHGIDLFVTRRPFVRAAVCGRSAKLALVNGQPLIGPAWGVCTTD